MSEASGVQSEWFRIDDLFDLFASTDRQCRICGVSCEVCGNTWGVAGLAYPTITCASLPAELAEVQGPLPTREYLRRKAAVIERIGTSRPIFPGTTFGERSAPARREPPRVCLDFNSLLLREEVAQDPAIRALGLRLARFVAKTARSGKSYVLYEVEAWPVATRPPRVLAARMRRVKPPCPACGFHRTPPYDIDRPDPLLRSSLDGLHVVRLDHAPGMMFVSAAFRDALVRHRPSRTLSFVPVKVVDA
ncbi:MAG: hypothetical protein HS111_07100 [Kofleriaceae bacterium]|nr:hypothetical protein [Kofleriaceae bacterium]MCL4225933.1 double-CXXCG motif protein [Myxococcales bacterium]